MHYANLLKKDPGSLETAALVVGALAGATVDDFTLRSLKGELHSFPSTTHHHGECREGRVAIAFELGAEWLIYGVYDEPTEAEANLLPALREASVRRRTHSESLAAPLAASDQANDDAGARGLSSTAVDPSTLNAQLDEKARALATNSNAHSNVSGPGPEAPPQDMGTNAGQPGGASAGDVTAPEASSSESAEADGAAPGDSDEGDVAGDDEAVRDRQLD